MPMKSKTMGRSRTARTGKKNNSASAKPKTTTTAKTKTAKQKTTTPAKTAPQNPRNRVRLWQNPKGSMGRSRTARVGGSEFTKRVESAYRTGGMDAANREFSNMTKQNQRASAYEKFRGNQTFRDTGIKRSTIEKRIAQTGKKNGTISIKKGGQTYSMKYWTGKNGTISASPNQ